MIDSLALKNDLEMLNTWTTNPNLVKIFHGCDSDIKWLQKDFGIYLVNVIDTFRIAQKFRTSNSLGALLKYFKKSLFWYCC